MGIVITPSGEPAVACDACDKCIEDLDAGVLLYREGVGSFVAHPGACRAETIADWECAWAGTWCEQPLARACRELVRRRHREIVRACASCNRVFRCTHPRKRFC